MKTKDVYKRHELYPQNVGAILIARSPKKLLKM